MSIGVNVLAQTVHDRARMYGWLAQAKPGLIVVCDEPDVATRCKMAAPGAIVAHRWIYEGDGSHTTMTAHEWAARFLPALPAGLYGYALNEPAGDWRGLSAWLVQVMSLAGAQNKPLIVGNLAMGNPPLDVIESGAFDELLKAFNDWPLHRFGLHEYANLNPAAEPWHVGRWKALQIRADKLGARGVRFVMTEAGRDVAGGPNDGWQAVMGEQQYADFLTAQADEYRAAAIPMAVFCYGTGGSGRWKTFDIQNAPVVLDSIVSYNADDHIVEGDEMVPGYVKAKTRQAGANVNVRVGPGLKHAPVTTVKTGDWVKRLPGSTISADGYTWAAIAVDKTADSHQHGFCALEVIWVGD